MVALDEAAWDAPWRRIRVGEKLILCLGLLVTVLVAPAWPASGLVAVTVVVLILGPARIPARVLAWGAAAPMTFITIGALSVAVQIGTSTTDVWLAAGPASVSPATAANAATVFARAVAGTLAVLLLATTTPMVDLLGWARRRGVPGPLVEVASLTYRLLFVLLETARNIHASQTARLGDSPTGHGRWRRRWRNVATAMGALLVRSWERARRLADGLAARGIDGDLAVLPSNHPASPKFITGTLALLAGIWSIAILSGVLS